LTSVNSPEVYPVFSVDTKTEPASSKPVPPRSPDLSPAAVARPEPAYKPAAAAANGVSVIGRDLTILGDKITIVSQNKLQVDGDVRGDVYGKQVVITTDGSVVGLVRAEKIEVHGAVSGSICAVTVVLHASARVDGDIMHQTLALAEGAQFEGRVRRSDDTSELLPVLDPEAVSSSRGAQRGFM
jgi:cytoskeletal protein CcmA (bactofilin family)